jgi:hypothetical protein
MSAWRWAALPVACLLAAGCGSGRTPAAHTSPQRPSQGIYTRAAGWRPVADSSGAAVMLFRCLPGHPGWTVQAVNDQRSPVTFFRAELVFTAGAAEVAQSNVYPPTGGTTMTMLPGYLVTLARNVLAPPGASCTVASWDEG